MKVLETIILQPLTPTAAMSREDQLDMVYPFWRWDMWFAGHGSYTWIEQNLEPFTCPAKDCNCRWTHTDGVVVSESEDL